MHPSQGRCCRFLLVIRNPWWDPSENTDLAKEVLGISSLAQPHNRQRSGTLLLLFKLRIIEVFPHVTLGRNLAASEPLKSETLSPPSQVGSSSVTRTVNGTGHTGPSEFSFFFVFLILLCDPYR